MNSFIEEFYYGNIDPQARSSEQNKKVQHDMQTLNESTLHGLSERGNIRAISENTNKTRKKYEKMIRLCHFGGVGSSFSLY